MTFDQQPQSQSRIAFGGIRKLLTLAMVGTLLSGCSAIDNMMYKTTGDVMQGFSRDHTVPYLLESNDLAMGCAMSEATAPLLMSFGRVTAEPDQLAVMLYLSAGGCAEERALEHELASLGAMKNLEADRAQDAIIQQKRALALAATRYFQAWKRHNTFYGEPVAGECPSFDDDLGEFIYLAGLLSGLQALNAEIQSTSAIGVPKNIGSTVARATQCLDNEKWWGAPMALRATIWSMIPGALPAGEDPFVRLDIAYEQGEKAGVRISHAFHAIAAQNKSDDKRLRSVIRSHAESLEETPSSEKWGLVDAMATQTIVAISDRLWMENTGHRTPMGRLGTFWDDEKKAVETMDLDGLL